MANGKNAANSGILSNPLYEKTAASTRAAIDRSLISLNSIILFRNKVLNARMAMLIMVKILIKPLLGFISTFPTATIIYLLLIYFTNLSFEWQWLVFAIVIDLLDDFIGNLNQL